MYEHRKSEPEDEKVSSKSKHALDAKVKITVKNDKKKKSVGLTKEEKSMFILSLDPYEKPLKWWESEPIKYAINYKPVRLRVEKLMGSKVIRLTDRKYMMNFMQNIRNDYRNEQLARIEKRKEWVKTTFVSYIGEDSSTIDL
ncbi:uncharacterized protein LOC122518067 [Polistes fuscatus]|uniref:uncharacterized protein LOC122518067 n=1 Tax=Polistes fuscatus TaxID=30207 RepID=UPI001CA99F9F|nr:uncharacterized protein LOC122518067 [Polistes fuscatus]